MIALRRNDVFEQPPVGCVVLHSIPTLPEGGDRAFLEPLHGRARRVVYLSTTSVYGDARFVDEHTPIQPVTESARSRGLTEAAVASGPWESLILRPAAIYGPGRGVHVALREGRYAMAADGSKFISRIHVDDLAAVVEAGLGAEITGAFPVADSRPCTSLEMASYCAGLLGVGLSAPGSGVVPESRRANRKVDGSAILRELKLTLRYPSFVEGVPACLDAESSTLEEAGGGGRVVECGGLENR